MINGHDEHNMNLDRRRYIFYRLYAVSRVIHVAIYLPSLPSLTSTIRQYSREMIWTSTAVQYLVTRASILYCVRISCLFHIRFG